MMKTRIRDAVYSAWLPYALMFALLLVWHARINGSLDDLYFAAAIDAEGGLVGFLVERYRTWSSRLLIEGVLVCMTQCIWLWRVLNSMVLTGIAALCVRLSGGEREPTMSWALCAMVLLIPYDVLNNAGWISTPLNYTWPAFCALAALLPMKRALCGEQLPKGEALIAVPALLLAANQEQFCVALLALLGAGVVQSLRVNGRVPRLCALELLLCVGMLAAIALCPGNRVRYAEETGKWFPEFDNLSFAVKAEMGYSSTGYGLVMHKNMPFLAFSLLLAALVWLKRKDFLARTASAIPAAASLTLGFFPQTLEVFLRRITSLRNALGDTGTGATIRSPGTLFPDLLLLAIFLCVAYSLLVGMGNKTGGAALFVLCVGLATRLAMGFSPTIWVSDERTFVPLYTAMLGIGATAIREIQRAPSGGELARKIKRTGAIALLLSLAERLV